MLRIERDRLRIEPGSGVIAQMRAAFSGKRPVISVRAAPGDPGRHHQRAGQSQPPSRRPAR